MRKHLLLGIFAILLVASIWTITYSATVTRPTKVFGGTEWLTGQSVTADDLNADVNTLYAHINGANISDANIDATGITTRTKLPAALAYEDESNSFTGTNTFTGVSTFDGADANVFDTTLGSNHQASTACDSGYTRVGLWCYDTDGDLTSVRGAISSDESGWTTTVVGASWKAVQIWSSVRGDQDGTPDAGFVQAAVVPGDSGVASPTAAESVSAAVALAGEASVNTATKILRTDSSGQIKTWCDITTGSGLTITCNWFIAAYMG